MNTVATPQNNFVMCQAISYEEIWLRFALPKNWFAGVFIIKGKIDPTCKAYRIWRHSCGLYSLSQPYHCVCFSLTNAVFFFLCHFLCRISPQPMSLKSMWNISERKWEHSVWFLACAHLTDPLTPRGNVWAVKGSFYLCHRLWTALGYMHLNKTFCPKCRHVETRKLLMHEPTTLGVKSN